MDAAGIAFGTVRAHRKVTVAFVVRALLWVIMIVAPGGIFLLPLLVGDSVARRRREERASKPDLAPLGASGGERSVQAAAQAQ